MQTGCYNIILNLKCYLTRISAGGKIGHREMSGFFAFYQHNN